jgi:predicted transcriptional regulator
MNEADDSRDERDIMTVAELAACLNVQANTIYRALPRLPHLKLSGKILISRKVIDEILRGERTLERS